VVRTEIAVYGGHVVLLMTADDGDGVVVEMSPDEWRAFVNSLGEAILRLTRVGVMAT
jgi:hypothetical protein